MKKIDKWFSNSLLYWFALGALWCASAAAVLWNGRAPAVVIPLFVAAALCFVVGVWKLRSAKK